MAFLRDEERSHSLLWFVSAMLFAGVSVWAVYDDQVTRAPWAAEQEEFFALERELAAKNLKTVQGRYQRSPKARLGELERRIAELEKKQGQSEHRAAALRLEELDERHADAESDKTFARSDQDEVYYYRTVAEYDVELATSAAQRGAHEAEVERLKAEEARYQREIDRAVAAMERIDSDRRRLRAKVAPVDDALEAARRELTVLRREVEEAELRAETARKLGPEILQAVFRWRFDESGRLIEDVDRCHTCHRGVDSGYYSDPTLVRNPELRTHPNRELLLAAHPVERFGCTPCHLGQGRATEATFAHSRAAPVLLPGPDAHAPRARAHVSWHMEGDHYWEEPMLEPGTLWRTRIDDATDELEVDLTGAGSKTVRLTHRTYELFADLRRELELRLNDSFPAAAGGDHEDRFAVHLVGNRVVLETLRRMSEGNRERAEADSLGRSEWGVRGGRGGPPGGAMTDPEADEALPPKFKVTWTDPALGTLLGFAGKLQGASSYTAPVSPEPRIATTGDRGTAGLQVPAGERERLILAAPFIESSCLRCHTQSTDFRPLLSVAEQVGRNAERQIERARWTPEETREHESDPGPKPEPDPEAVPDLAPTLTEGRYLFRKLNCTGCHILDGFPGNRNAGPGLDGVAAKVEPGFLYSWIRYPRLFRSGTAMPNLWPLPLDPETKEPVRRGTAAYRQWDTRRDEEVTAIAAYLLAKSRHDVPAGYGNVEGATAEAGKESFETLGCQGCHVTVPDEDRPGPFGARERDVAPNLANIGSKTNADWLTWWIENPARYWSGTKMPNLRLTRLEAASIARYLMTLRTGPAVDDAPAVLRSGSSPDLVQKGRQLIANYGCYGCHQIAGFEGAPPIAPELNGHARKDVTTLDFGYAVPDHREQTWETFVTWKLDAPRIYSRDRIELRMGDFDLSPHEIRALLVFLKGTQEDRVAPQYDPQLSERGRAILAGRQIVEDYNCRGCHVIEGRGADIRTFFPLTPEALALAPPVLRAEGFRVQPEWLYSFLRAPYRIRPWIDVRMPTFNFTNEQATAVARYFAALDGQEFPYQRQPSEPMAPERWDQANRLFAQLQCQSCHVLTDEVPAGRDPAQLAPNLQRAPERLRPQWMHRWLENPEALQPNTRMPSFFTEPFGVEPSPYSSVAHGTAQDNIELLVELLTHLDRQPPVAPEATGAGATPTQ
ncbi:MAG: c-type cytochrome [Deltaproteobacteria bacterium]|nr:c-type cytochrome [Deltaproteobacteria bacterium]